MPLILKRRFMAIQSELNAVNLMLTAIGDGNKHRRA